MDNTKNFGRQLKKNKRYLFQNYKPDLTVTTENGIGMGMQWLIPPPPFQPSKG